MIILSRAQARQPQTATRLSQKWIDKGLVALFDLRTGVELITGLAASADTSTPIAGVNGAGRDFSGAANVQFPHHPRFAITGDLTIAALVDIDALSGYTAIISKNATPTTATPYELRLGVGATDSQIDFVRANSGVRENRHGATTLGARYSGLIVATQRAAIEDATGKFYTKDASYPLAAGTGAGTGPATDTGATVFIGRRYDGATQLDGRIYYVALFNKLLSDFESKELIAQPRQIFAPAAQRIWVAPTAGGVSSAIASSSSALPGSTSALSTAISLAAASTAKPGSASALTAGTGLSAATSASPSSNSTLSTAIRLEASSVASPAATSALTTGNGLVSSSSATTSSTSALTTAIRLTAINVAVTSSSAVLTTGIRLAASGAAIPASSSSLDEVAPTYIPAPRQFTSPARGQAFTSPARGQAFTSPARTQSLTSPARSGA